MICLKQVKTGEKVETGVHWGGGSIEQYQTNIVYNDEPLKLKTVVSYGII